MILIKKEEPEALTPWQLRTIDIVDEKIKELNKILIDAYENLNDDGKLSAAFALQSFVDASGLAKEAIQNMGGQNV